MNEDERVKKLIRSNVVGTGHSDLFVKETNWRSEPKKSDYNYKEVIEKLKDQKNQYQYSDFQKSERDFAFVIDKNFKVQDLVSIISEIDKNLIRLVKVFDVYEGENIPNDKKSIALNVTIQSSEKTLNDEDLEKVNQLIISTVESKSGAKIRS